VDSTGRGAPPLNTPGHDGRSLAAGSGPSCNSIIAVGDQRATQPDELLDLDRRIPGCASSTTQRVGRHRTRSSATRIPTGSATTRLTSRTPKHVAVPDSRTTPRVASHTAGSCAAPAVAGERRIGSRSKEWAHLSRPRPGSGPGTRMASSSPRLRWALARFARNFKPPPRLWRCCSSETTPG